MSWYDHLRGQLSEEAFAMQLISRLQQAGDQRPVSFDAERFRICFSPAGAEAGHVNLRNLYDEYLIHPVRDRDRFFQFAVRSLLASHKPLPDDYADAAPDILLTVRSRSYYSLMELSSWVKGNPSFSWPYQPLADHLGIGLVYDLPEAMVMLQASHLEAWGVTFYEAFERGMSNLTEIDATFTTIDDHSYASATSDHYDASRILLPELIHELEVVGDPVVLLPNRDRLLVTGSEDRHGLETVALLAQQLLTHPRPVSGLAFRLSNHEWSCWLPDQDHPAYALLKTLGLQTYQLDYAEQHPLLQQWLAHRQDRVQVAPFRLHGAQAKQPPTSFSVCREGEKWLLPLTDRICFLRRDQPLDHPLVEGVNASWGRVQELLGDRLCEEESLYPARYRIEQFPTDAQLAWLQRSDAP